MHCKAMELAAKGMVSILALQELIKSLMIGRMPTQEEWDTARMAVNRFTETATQVRTIVELGRNPHQELTHLDIN